MYGRYSRASRRLLQHAQQWFSLELPSLAFTHSGLVTPLLALSLGAFQVRYVTLSPATRNFGYLHEAVSAPIGVQNPLQSCHGHKANTSQGLRGHLLMVTLSW